MRDFIRDFWWVIVLVVALVTGAAFAIRYENAKREVRYQRFDAISPSLSPAFRSASENGAQVDILLAELERCHSAKDSADDAR